LIRSSRIVILIVAIAAAVPGTSDAQPRGPRGGGCMMMGAGGGMADMQQIHELFASGDKVRRTVTTRPDGVETTTESDDPAVAKTIQTHVAAMYQRVRDGRGIHLRDPLFRELFAHASSISMTHELTPKGVKVVETSTDPYVVKLIQAHAEVVTRFLQNGHVEAMKNHAVPAKEQ
jgi:hypothetical protein